MNRIELSMPYNGSALSSAILECIGGVIQSKKGVAESGSADLPVPLNGKMHCENTERCTVT